MGELSSDPRQQAILDSAWKSFAAYGFRKTSMDDIARGAGISWPALYLHYRNKEDIFRTLTQYFYDTAAADVAAALARGADIPATLAAAFAAQAGEIIEGLKSGTLTEQHLLAEIGAVLNGDADGRLQDSDVTLYRSMGVAAQDLICAHHVLQVAAQKDIGTIAPF